MTILHSDDAAMILDLAQDLRAEALPLYVSDLVARLNTLGQDLPMLRTLGDDQAIAGAKRLLRETVLELLAMPANDLASLERKARTLTRHSADLGPAWLVEIMAGTSLRVEWDVLGISAVEEKRLRAMLTRRLGVESKAWKPARLH